MPPFPFDVVVFDLDGTLADTAPDLTASLNHALAAMGRPCIPAEDVRNLVGHGARALLRKGLAATGDGSEAIVEKALPIFLSYYGDHIRDGTTTYAGVEEALQALQAEGARIAVCTNKPEALTLKLFDALGWSSLFDAVVGADTTLFRKPDPRPLQEAVARAGGGRAVLVGDSITDADTARAAGVSFVAVSFGFSDQPVAQLAADAVIDRYEELLPTLRRLSDVP